MEFKQSTLTETFGNNFIRDMKIGEIGYTPYKALSASINGNLWMSQVHCYGSNRFEVFQLKIARVSGGILVERKQLENDQFTVSYLGSNSMPQFPVMLVDKICADMV